MIANLAIPPLPTRQAPAPTGPISFGRGHYFTMAPDASVTGKLTAARRHLRGIGVPAEAALDRPTLAASLSGHTSVKETSVRGTINVLLAQHLLEQVTHQRAMTVALTPGGEQALTVALRRDAKPRDDA